MHCSPYAMPMFSDDRCVSFDGDADRIVFFSVRDRNEFILFDGDKISALAATVLKELCEQADIDLRLGVVQTAYANGNATRYIQEALRIPLIFTKTGVKYLHERAEEFDIGIYFEANGHGTILFNSNAIEIIHARANDM